VSVADVLHPSSHQWCAYRTFLGYVSYCACFLVGQALNNWGLALQELGAIVPLKEKRAIVKKAVRKFRAAIQLQFDFHRAVYNLGTVLVSEWSLSYSTD
jgi:hypothetical protein